jgi:hypothetical protein
VKNVPDRREESTRWAAVCVLAVCLAVASAAPAFAQQVQGVTKTEILIGTIQDLSGPLAGYGKPARNGLQLWAADVHVPVRADAHPVPELDVEGHHRPVVAKASLDVRLKPQLVPNRRADVVTADEELVGVRTESAPDAGTALGEGRCRR